MQSNRQFNQRFKGQKVFAAFSMTLACAGLMLLETPTHSAQLAQVAMLTDSVEQSVEQHCLADEVKWRSLFHAASVDSAALCHQTQQAQVSHSNLARASEKRTSEKRTLPAEVSLAWVGSQMSLWAQ